MFPLALLPLIGAGAGALTNLNNPDQMWKNMGIGAGIGGLGAGAGMLAGGSLLGGGAAPIALQGTSAPAYSLTGAASYGSAPSFAGVGNIAANPALMPASYAPTTLTSASGGTVAGGAGGGMNTQALLRAMMFAKNAMGDQQQQPQQMPVPPMQQMPRPAFMRGQRMMSQEMPIFPVSAALLGGY